MEAAGFEGHGRYLTEMLEGVSLLMDGKRFNISSLVCTSGFLVTCWCHFTVFLIFSIEYMDFG